MMHPKTSPLVALVALVVAAVATTTIAQDDPNRYDTYYVNHSRGMSQSIFDASMVDNVGLYNGNLTATVPLGPVLHPGGNARLQLALHLNSTIWADEARCAGHEIGTPEDTDCEDFGIGALLGTRYVGVGWSLHFGLIARKMLDEVFLVSPDGTEHQLFTSRFGAYERCSLTLAEDVCFTRDGSDILVEVVAGGYQASFPDGTMRHYGPSLANYRHPQEPEEWNRTFIGRDFARMRDGAYCDRIEDRWGNHIDITYQTSTYNEAYVDDTDPFGNVVEQLIPAGISEVRADGTVLRTVELVTERPAPIGTQTRPKRITDVVFKDPAGTELLRYELSYAAYDYVQRLELQSYLELSSSTPDEAKHTDWVYFLDGIAVQNTDWAYAFNYWTCADEGTAVGDEDPVCPVGTPEADKLVLDTTTYYDPGGRWAGLRRGVLRRLQLPTGGVITYDYDLYTYDHHSVEVHITSDSEQCAVDGLACGLPLTESCGPAINRNLGVSKREIFDGAQLLSRTTYHMGGGGQLNLPVRFDAGNPDVPNPTPGDPDTAEVLPYYTSTAVTHVVTDYVVDENGSSSTDLGTAWRSDESVFHFSMGTTILDRNNDCWIGPAEPYTLPLAGALIYEQHYRGTVATGQLDETVVHTYTVDDSARGWGRSGPEYATQVNRRPRDVITYTHDPSNTSVVDHYTVTRYRYESDGCYESGDTCPQLVLPATYTDDPFKAAFASHVTAVESQTAFRSTSVALSEATMFDVLDTTTFDRVDRSTFWKGAIAVGPGIEDGDWLLHRTENQRVEAAGTVELESSQELDPSTGAVVLERVHADPGAGISSDDVVTRYAYVTDSTDPGCGLMRWRLQGLWSRLQGENLDETNPDLSEYIEYQHAMPSRVWLLCHSQEQPTVEAQMVASCNATAAQRCAGWTVPAAPAHLHALGLPAELQRHESIHPGWRTLTSDVDGSGNGIASMTYDDLGRMTGIQPTDPDLSPTWLSYPDQNTVLVTLLNIDGVQHVVTRADYDGLGRLTHHAIRRPGTASTTYLADDFRHKTFRLDGNGNRWRESDWQSASDLGTGALNATRTLTVDRHGRAETIVRSDGGTTRISFVGGKRSDGRVFDTDGTTLLSRSVTDSDPRGNIVRALEDKDPTTASEDLENPTIDDFVISSYVYDAGDRLTDITVTGKVGTSAVTQQRSATYDHRGFLVGERFPELATSAADTENIVSYCSHDGMGRPRRAMWRASCDQQPSDDIIDSYFDAAGRPLQHWYKVAGDWYIGAEATYGSTGNALGKPITATQLNFVTATPLPPSPGACLEPSSIRIRHTNTYDGPQGMLSSRVTDVAFDSDGSAGAVALATNYQYDRWANIEQIDYPQLTVGTGCTAPPAVTFSHDAIGLLGISETRFGDTRSLLSNPGYDTNTGMMTEWTTAAGYAYDGISLTTVKHEVIPDGTRSRIQRITVSDPSGSLIYFDTGSYTFNGAGNIMGIAGSSATAGWSYTYDALNRLTSATSGTVRSCSYDDFANLTSLAGATIPIDSATNRLASSSGFGYDSRGNLTHEPMTPDWTRRARYGPANRMMAAWSTGTAAPDDTHGFAYDIAGERVLSYRIADGTVQDATFTIRDETGNVLTELLWHPTTPGSTLGTWTRMSDHVYLGREPIIRIETLGSARHFVTLVQDHLGSTRAEISDADPEAPVFTTIEYWPFGELVSHPDGLAEKHLFTAHERDFLGDSSGVSSLEGIDSMHTRYYSYLQGRFRSIDSMGGTVSSSQTWNRYAYATNNPVSSIDPWGETVIVLDDQAWEALQEMLGENRGLVSRSADGTLSVSATSEELASNEALSLVKNLETANEVYGVTVSEVMPTREGDWSLSENRLLAVNASVNTDTEGGQSRHILPPDRFDGVATVHPGAGTIGTEENGSPASIANLLFHELAEVYSRTTSCQPYASAHERATNRENILRKQRPRLATKPPGYGPIYTTPSAWRQWLKTR